MDRLLTNSSDVNPLPLPDSIEFDSQKKNVLVRQPIKVAIVIDITKFCCLLFAFAIDL